MKGTITDSNKSVHSLRLKIRKSLSQAARVAKTSKVKIVQCSLMPSKKVLVKTVFIVSTDSEVLLLNLLQIILACSAVAQ